VQSGGGGGGGFGGLGSDGGVEDGVDVPPPALLPPEHPHDCCSSQVNPGPQSAAAWQGSCQRGAHWCEVTVVQVPVMSAASFAGGGQMVLGGHASVAAPVEHCVCSNAAHTMSAPQSLSLAQAAGEQTYELCGVQGGQLSPSRHAIAGHAPGTT